MDPIDVNILVIDDVQSVRIQLEELLKSFGFRRVTAAASVPEARLAMEKEAFQLILCDWHMVPITGLEFVRHVRQQAALKDIPFIMVTAESTKERVIEAIQAGIDDYIVKPLTLGHMNKVYKILLKKQGA